MDTSKKTVHPAKNQQTTTTATTTTTTNKSESATLKKKAVQNGKKKVGIRGQKKEVQSLPIKNSYEKDEKVVAFDPKDREFYDGTIMSCEKNKYCKVKFKMIDDVENYCSVVPIHHIVPLNFTKTYLCPICKKKMKECNDGSKEKHHNVYVHMDKEHSHKMLRVHLNLDAKIGKYDIKVLEKLNKNDFEIIQEKNSNKSDTLTIKPVVVGDKIQVKSKGNLVATNFGLKPKSKLNNNKPGQTSKQYNNRSVGSKTRKDKTTVTRQKTNKNKSTKNTMQNRVMGNTSSDVNVNISDGGTRGMFNVTNVQVTKKKKASRHFMDNNYNKKDDNGDKTKTRNNKNNKIVTKKGVNLIKNYKQSVQIEAQRHNKQSTSTIFKNRFHTQAKKKIPSSGQGQKKNISSAHLSNVDLQRKTPERKMKEQSNNNNVVNNDLPIKKSQPVPTADLNGATHTVVHQALQGVNVGAAENSYASTQPSFATNQLAYRLQAVAHHRSQIGAAADAQTRILQHPSETYGGGNVPYHSLHPPVIGYQRAPAHYITTTSASRPGDGTYGRNNGSLQFYNSNNWNGNKIPDKNIQKIVDNELKDLIEKFGLGILKDRGKNMFLSKLVGTMDDFYPHQGWTRESLRPYLQNAILSREEKTRAKTIQRQNTQTTMNTNSNNTKIINTSNITNNNNDGEWPTKPTKP